MQLRNKTILVTGGARGLGRAFAEAAVKAGAHVLIADVIDGTEVAKQIGACFLPVDLASPSSIQDLSKKVEKLDGLVNNAAIATGIGGKSMEEIDLETWDRVMQVNVRGTWLMTRACLPALKRSRSAHVLNIASDTALWGAPRLMHYVASKGAVMFLLSDDAAFMTGQVLPVNGGFVMN